MKKCNDEIMNQEKRSIDSLIGSIEGLITLGGLSECGKSCVGKYFESQNITKLKIIEFEKEIMIEDDYDLSLGVTTEIYDHFYSKDNEIIYERFLNKVLLYMTTNNIKVASIESLYRPSMARYLKQRLNDKCLNIFLEAPFETRVYREWLKVSQNKKVSLEDIEKEVMRKDLFKRKYGAHLVNDTADYIIDNSISIDLLYKRIDSILEKYQFNVR